MLTYNDVARVNTDAPAALQPGRRCWIIGVVSPDERAQLPLPGLPPGTVYTVEFEGGGAIDVHEADLEPWPANVG